ncbi:hypothetical protein BSV1_R42 (plasmid) [Borreliella finlandensis]|uniref:Uncharacterized protein n=1 Tax=Borreliella finlandensis TaxID=498741 RepID=A0A806CKY4_9SPIR|nr:hypothetical protein BSV1_R42 [Borreliella finlandensis]
MSINNYLNLNKDSAKLLLKLAKDYQKILKENKILKNTLKTKKLTTKY